MDQLSLKIEQRLSVVEGKLNGGSSSYIQTSNRKIPLPYPLKVAKAKRVLKKLVKAGWMDMHWQPQQLNNEQLGVLAKYISDILHIDQRWVTFGQLWHIDPETLRSAFNKACNKRKMLSFQDEIKDCFK